MYLLECRWCFVLFYFASTSKTANDFQYIEGGNLIVTAGESSNGLNVCIWSLLLPLEERLICSFKCHEGSGGATSIAYIPHNNCLVTGGKGSINIFSLTTLSLVKRIETAKNAKAYRLVNDNWTPLLFAGFTDGAVRVNVSLTCTFAASLTHGVMLNVYVHPPCCFTTRSGQVLPGSF